MALRLQDKNVQAAQAAPGNRVFSTSQSRGIDDIQQATQRFFDPTTRARLGETMGGLLGMTQGAQGLGGQLFTGFAGLAPQLQAQFRGPQFSQQLDPFAQNILSQGRQALSAGASRAAQQAARQVGGGAGQVLGQQARAQARLQQNPLLFQAAQQQRAREAQEFGLAQQAQQLSNQAALAQSQANIQGQQLQNQALLQSGLLPLQLQQNLLQNLGQFAQLTGAQGVFDVESEADIQRRFG